MSTIASIVIYVVWRIIVDRKAKERIEGMEIKQQVTEARLKRIEDALTNNPFIPFNK